ncbi:hypothetical protein [Dactylosporangium sp. NPDC049140]|uniref:hypothetical protein n=1 Tax=Dactylosporangium sp. NPDC049140 TaxID=3155647 RepID=UPI0033BFC528
MLICGVIAYGTVPGWFLLGALAGRDRGRVAGGVLMLVLTAGIAALAGGPAAAGPAALGALLGCTAHRLVRHRARAAAVQEELP